MTNSHESIRKIGEEPQVDTVATSDSLDRLVDLRKKEKQLIQQMLEKTHELVRQAFEWQKEQGLKWKKSWKPEVGLQETRHISYYYITEEDINPCLLEVFQPVIIDHFLSVPISPETLCIVEYPLDSGENPLDFNSNKPIGASVFGKHADKISENLAEAIKENALAVASYATHPVFIDERSREDRISGGGNSFGWSAASIRGEYRTRIPTYNPLSEFSGANVSFQTIPGNNTDPLFEGQRRLGLLKNAQLVGISVPPERVIAPYSQT